MSHIFISYGHEDLEFVQTLVQAFNDRGRPTWHDHRIRTSRRWFHELTMAIKESYAMIVVMSLHAEESNFVHKEILLAEKYEIPIYPLLIHGTGLDYLIDRQYYDLTGEKMPAEKLFEELPDPPVRLESIETADRLPDDDPDEEIDFSKYVNDKTIKYDDASWHYEGDFPENIDGAQGFVHIGMYLGWLIDHDMISEEFRNDYRSEIVGFKERMISCAHILELMDGKLASCDLNAEGNAFSQYYYDDYLEDIGMLAESSRMLSTYHVKDTWDNYEKIKNMINKNYVGWRAGVIDGWEPRTNTPLIVRFLEKLKKYLPFRTQTSG